VSRRRAESFRFAFCRGLYEYLFGMRLPALVSDADADEQKRNRAFAAELLAPADALRRQLTGSVVTADEVDDLAERFMVSPLVVRYQLRNHRLAEVVEAG
jgi:Zn-dependent peptidase ImmA (M78 family)